MWDLIVSVPDHCLSFYFEHATSRTRLALGRAPLCFHFNVEPHSPEIPEHVKVKYPAENSRLVLIESFHEIQEEAITLMLP